MVDHVDSITNKVNKAKVLNFSTGVAGVSNRKTTINYILMPKLLENIIASLTVPSWSNVLGSADPPINYVAFTLAKESSPPSRRTLLSVREIMNAKIFNLSLHCLIRGN